MRNYSSRKPKQHQTNKGFWLEKQLSVLVDPCGEEEGTGGLFLPTKLWVLFAPSEEQEPLELEEAFFVISLDEDFALGRWLEEEEEDVWFWADNNPP